MAAKKISDLTSILGTDLLTTDLLLVARTAGNINRKLTVGELKSLLITKASDVLDEDDFASDSNTKVPTQQSTKAYVDAVISTVAALTTTVSGKILRSIGTTKGDLLVYTAADTVVRQAVGSNDQVLVADSSQTNGLAYHTDLHSDFLNNIGLVSSVGSSALTVALKTAAGANASATDPLKAVFRSATLTDGTLTLVKGTAALSLVVSSGSTLGHANGIASDIYVYLINSAGTLKLGLSTSLFDETGLVTTVAEGGAGAADSNQSMYSDAVYTNVAFRLIGKLISNQVTAGTYAAAPTSTIVGSYAKLAALDNVSAMAGGNPASATPGNPFIFPTTLFDTKNNYSSSTGRFTCSSNGKYLMNMAYTGSGGSSATIYAYINGSLYLEAGAYFATAVGGTATCTIPCARGDIIDFRSNNTVDFTAGSVSFVRVGN